MYDVLDVVGEVRLIWDYLVQRGFCLVDRVGSGGARRVVVIVGGNKVEQLAKDGQAFSVVASDEGGYT